MAPKQAPDPQRNAVRRKHRASIHNTALTAFVLLSMLSPGLQARAAASEKQFQLSGSYFVFVAGEDTISERRYLSWDTKETWADATVEKNDSCLWKFQAVSTGTSQNTYHITNQHAGKFKDYYLSWDAGVNVTVEKSDVVEWEVLAGATPGSFRLVNRYGGPGAPYYGKEISGAGGTNAKLAEEGTEFFAVPILYGDYYVATKWGAGEDDYGYLSWDGKGTWANATVERNDPCLWQLTIVSADTYRITNRHPGEFLGYYLSWDEGSPINATVEKSDIAPWRIVPGSKIGRYRIQNAFDGPSHASFGLPLSGGRDGNANAFVGDTNPLEWTFCRDSATGRMNGEVRFTVTADPQINNHKSETADGRAEISTKTEQATQIMQHLWEQVPHASRGVLVAGDVVQNTRKGEILTFYNTVLPSKATTLDGISAPGRLYEGLGNHDANAGSCCVGTGSNENCVCPVPLSDIVGRHRNGRVSTAKLDQLAESNSNYAWRWGGVLFCQLNIAPIDKLLGNGFEEEELDSLKYLDCFLKEFATPGKTPVVLIQHYGFDSFSKQLNEKDKHGNPDSEHYNKNWEDWMDKTARWWSDDQRSELWNRIARYNVVAIFTGHSHRSAGQTSYEPFTRPVGKTHESVRGPNSVPAFVSGAALYGVYLECRITNSELIIDRYSMTSAAPSINETHRVGLAYPGTGKSRFYKKEK